MAGLMKGWPGVIAADGEFVGYLFKYGPPPRRARLWFIDRELGGLLPFAHLMEGTDLTVTIEQDEGRWSATMPDHTTELAGLCVRYDHETGESAVWRLTDTTIPHVTVLGRDDDVWRLGVWPD